MSFPTQPNGSGAAITDDNLSRDLEAKMLSGQTAIEYLAQNIPPVELAFRWIGPHTLRNRQCVEDVGMFSQRPGNSSEPVWQKDRLIRHLHGTSPSTSTYLSISTSPGRMLNFIVGPDRKPNAEIAVINLNLLRIMQRNIRTSTSFIDEFNLIVGREQEGRTRFITPTHLLVHEFIPACCVLGYVSVGTFWDICGTDFTEARDPGYERRLDWATLKPHAQRSSAFSVRPQLTIDVPHAQNNPLQPMTPPGSRSRRQSRHQRDPFQSPTRGSARARQAAPSPSPSPPQFNLHVNHRYIIDLTGPGTL